MPEIIDLKLSDSYLLADKNSKYIPDERMFSEDMYYREVLIERKTFALNLNLLSPDDAALTEFGQSLSLVIDSQKETREDESELELYPVKLSIQRITTDSNVDSVLSSSNCIININILSKQSNNQSTIVELDIDPEIQFDNTHIYTFSSNRNMKKRNYINVLSNRGRVKCKLYSDAPEILNKINSVQEDKHATIFTKTEFDNLITNLDLEEASIQSSNKENIVSSGGSSAKYDFSEKADNFYALTVTGFGDKDKKEGTIRQRASTYTIQGKFTIQQNQNV